MRDTEETVWERGWDGHRQAQLRRLAQLSLGEKLQWLEEAQQLVWRLSRHSSNGAERTDRGRTS